MELIQEGGIQLILFQFPVVQIRLLPFPPGCAVGTEGDDLKLSLLAGRGIGLQASPRIGRHLCEISAGLPVSGAGL